MLETLSYTEIKGKRADRAITVYALSTCGFCRRALSWLDDKGFSYRYIYVDRIPLEAKSAAKKILKERYKDDVAFPFTVIDDGEHLVGFIEADWVKTLGK